MSRIRSHAAVATALVLTSLVGCTPSSTSTPLPSSPANATTLLVRLGNDTLAAERYTRSGARMQGVLVQRVPFTTVAHYTVDIGPGEVPEGRDGWHRDSLWPECRAADAR